MLHSLISFYGRSPDRAIGEGEPRPTSGFSQRRWAAFVSITIGYSAFYVCRYSWNVVKKPLVDEGIFDTSQMGWIGSALFFSYAFGKLLNGVLADHANVRRFMATGLAVSALANLILGFTTCFWIFLVLWCANGWFQSFGAPSSVVTLSQWYGDRERGTFYGIWSSSHNLGGAATYVGTAFIAGAAGWQWGFRMAGVVGLCIAALLWRFLSERPQVYGFASPIGTPRGNLPISVGTKQVQVFKTPAIWILAAASACMYVVRYAVDSWGIFFLQTEKCYSLEGASSILGLKDVCGIVGTLLSGVMSDRYFNGQRGLPALLSGILYASAIALFVWGPASPTLDSLSMILFGLSLGVLLCFLGGLMAVDICPKEAAGTALGLVGVASYLGAGIQDILSGHVIENGKHVVDNNTCYDFSAASTMWVGAAVLSLLLTTVVWYATTDS